MMVSRLRAMAVAPYPSLVFDRLRQWSPHRAFQHQTGREPESGRVEKPQQDVISPIGLRLQRRHALLTHGFDETVHHCLADAMVATVVLDAAPVGRTHSLPQADTTL